MIQKQDGYIIDTVYPYYFYKEMQPLWLSTVVTFQGSKSPDISNAFSYCELGCGTGLSLIIAAAMNPHARFVGVDFNAQHIKMAQEAVQLIGLKNIQFICSDFRTFLQMLDEKFDFIVIHGTWSWVAPSVQKEILEIIAIALKPQGMCYIHYMCHPGSTAMIPIQKFFHAIASPIKGSAQEAVQKALDSLQELMATGLFAHQPELIARLEKLYDVPMDDLVHDFLTDYWSVQHSVDMHGLLSAQAGVHFIGSAEVFENMDTSLSIPHEIQPLLAKLRTPRQSETIKDMARHQRQRTDIFQREPLYLDTHEHLSALNEVEFKLIVDIPDMKNLKFKTPIGEIKAPRDVFSPLFQKLFNAPASFAELMSLPEFKNRAGLLFQSLQMLMHQGYLHPLSHNQHLLEPKVITRLNTWLSQKHLHLTLVDACATAVKIDEEKHH